MYNLRTHFGSAFILNNKNVVIYLLDTSYYFKIFGDRKGRLDISRMKRADENGEDYDYKVSVKSVSLPLHTLNIRQELHYTQ